MNVYMIKKVQEAYLKKICIYFYNFLNLVLHFQPHIYSRI